MKKIVTGHSVSIKDENGHYVQSHTVSEPVRVDPLPSDISLSDLLNKHLLVLYRETMTLLQDTSQGRALSKEQAHSMRENIKLLMELIKKEKELLASLPKEELDKLLSHDKT